MSISSPRSCKFAQARCFYILDHENFAGHEQIIVLEFQNYGPCGVTTSDTSTSNTPQTGTAITSSSIPLVTTVVNPNENTSAVTTTMQPVPSSATAGMYGVCFCFFFYYWSLLAVLCRHQLWSHLGFWTSSMKSSIYGIWTYNKTYWNFLQSHYSK